MADSKQSTARQRTNGPKKASTDLPPEQYEWLRATMNRILKLERDRDKLNAKIAACRQRLYEMGYSHDEVRLMEKQPHFLPDLERGRAVRRGASSGGKSRATAANLLKAWQHEDDRLRRENPTLSKIERARRIAKACGGSKDTIRKHIA